MQRINIFLDLIGIKSLLKGNRDEAIKKLKKFWQCVYSLGVYPNFPPSVLLNNVDYKPIVKYYTFSDSAFFYFETEVTDQYACNTFIDTLRGVLKDFEFYIIISKGEEISADDFNWFGTTSSSYDGRPDYTHMVGSGDAWINIFAVEEYLKGKKDLHQKYNSYAIGFDKSIGKQWNLIESDMKLFACKI